MRYVWPWLSIVALLLLAISLGALVDLRGLSARAEPTAAERVLATLARRWAVPRKERELPNPVAFSPEVWNEAIAHFADHCAACHGNDGSGETEIGRNLYPRAPDMRLLATQQFTDGELYYIIENGVRLTGMPAWGDGGDHDRDTWKLVYFVRHLKDLTAEQLKTMASLNPRSPSELMEEQEDQRFLLGEDVPSTEASSPAHHHH